jgi:hypothetical protein
MNDSRSTEWEFQEVAARHFGETSRKARVGTSYVAALKRGHQFPPIVVFPNQRGWCLLDGVNRTHAYVLLGTQRVRAYELLLR